MTKHTIEIEGLPEGWEPVAFRYPIGNIEYVFTNNEIRKAKPTDKRCLIVGMSNPREITLVEISREEYFSLFHDECGIKIFDMDGSYWRIKEE